MTRVEELAGKLGYYIESDDIGGGDDLLKELLDAAHEEVVASHAEGVKEGAEQERERIRKAVIEELHDPDWDSDIIPASVLAPTKEKT